MSASSYVYVQVDRIVRETDKALLCDIGGEEMWLPKSQIADADDYCDGDEDVEIAITDWLAKEKGLD